MSTNQSDRDPLLRVHLIVPKSLAWMLTGAVLGNLNDVGALLSALGKLLQ
ncbi:hypothetical protein [Micromonospora haikouensis]